MTENRAPHLSDEWLSAHLDAEDSGSDDLENERHLASCESCAARADALHAAKRLVSTPVGSAAAEPRSRAVSAALAAFGAGGATETESSDAGATTPQSIETAHRRWYRRQPVLVGAVATAAVILALAVALPLTLTGKGGSTTSAAKSPQRSSAPQAASPGAAGTGTASSTEGAAGSGAGGAAGSPVPDLGTVTSKQELISRVRALGASYQGAQAGQPSANSGGVSASEGGAAASSPYSMVANCVAHTQDETGDHYGPGVVATVTYDDQRSIVMELWNVASPPAAGKGQLAVATEADCKLLLTAAF